MKANYRCALELDRCEVRAVGLRGRPDCAVVQSAFSETARGADSAWFIIDR